MDVETGGPFLQAALICERALQEQDGVLSVIRVIDRVFFVVDADGNLVHPVHPITLVVSLKSGQARGTFNVEIRQEKPSGEQAPVLSAPVFLEGGERGVNVVVTAGFQPDQAGLYWFDVYFEGSRITRIPLRAVFQPLPSPGA